MLFFVCCCLDQDLTYSVRQLAIKDSKMISAFYSGLHEESILTQKALSFIPSSFSNKNLFASEDLYEILHSLIILKFTISH